LKYKIYICCHLTRYRRLPIYNSFRFWEPWECDRTKSRPTFFLLFQKLLHLNTYITIGKKMPTF